MDAESFGAWLKRRRLALGLTQATLAEQAGCSLVALRKIEADARRPSAQLARPSPARLVCPPHSTRHLPPLLVVNSPPTDCPLPKHSTPHPTRSPACFLTRQPRSSGVTPTWPSATDCWPRVRGCSP
jgi:DNA-binding XRE family transcriptional regulator